MILTPIQSFKNFIETNLNSEQKKAVTAANGSYLVIAGAGSGKTRVITARITNLILEHNVEPSSIIALTFTNKAAQEMQHRIQSFLPHLRTKPYIATFHAYCLMLLKKNMHLLDKETFTVIDAQDSQKLLTSILKDRGLERLFNSKQLLPMFSTIKLSQLLKTDLPEWNMHHMQQFIEIYNAYEQQKRLSNYLDFDDLLYTTYKLFSSNDAFKLKHIQNHRHILVDEYQDTNTIQHALLKQMTLINDQDFAIDSVCAVGDEDQSIYSWRGATVQNILEFNQQFLNTKIIKLEQNYRSTQSILDIANHVIRHNMNRNHKQLWSSNTQNHKPLILECLSDLQEAGVIAQLINILSKKDKRSDIAILYRTHYQSRVLEEALLKEAIPYKIIGGIQFYERKEIKDMLAYLRLCVNPYDRISFFRVINCPLRGLGEKFEEMFLQLWNQNPLSTFQEIIKIMLDQDLVSNKQKTSITQFLELFENIPSENVTKVLEHFILQTNYIAYLVDNHEKREAEEKRENVGEFVRAANHFDETSNTGLSQFLDEIALMQEQIKKEDSSIDCIQMMSLHAAKGLEFKNVILAGLEEGILPSNQSIGQENVEEERRLFYVGITRAQQKLFITTSKYRNVFGKLDEQRPSRFLQEIPLNLAQRQPAAHWSRSGFHTFLQDWVDQRTSSSISSNFIKTTNINTSDNQTAQSGCNFKRLQTVKHPTFGLGIAHSIEQKGDKFFITVQFANHGSKRIESSFLTIV